MKLEPLWELEDEEIREKDGDGEGQGWNYAFLAGRQLDIASRDEDPVREMGVAAFMVGSWLMKKVVMPYIMGPALRMFPTPVDPFTVPSIWFMDCEADLWWVGDVVARRTEWFEDENGEHEGRSPNGDGGFGF